MCLSCDEIFHRPVLNDSEECENVFWWQTHNSLHVVRKIWESTVQINAQPSYLFDILNAVCSRKNTGNEKEARKKVHEEWKYM